MNILIVEDQHDIAANIWDFLERRGHVLDHAADGAGGLNLAMHGRFDAIVLDLGLPRLDGLLLCRRLREAGRGTPVIMLTARDTLDDKLKGFAEGADDYMVKPFELRELEARLLNLHKRQRTRSSGSRIIGPLQFERDSMLAIRDGVRIELTQAQSALLELLMLRSPAVISHMELADQLWGDQEFDRAAIHNHVYALRQLIDRPFAQPLIRSVHGVGYRLMPPND